MPAEITLYDQPLSEVVQKHAKIVFAYPKEKVWNKNGVSLDERLKADPKLKSRIAKALKPSNLTKYMVSDDDAAPTRCIDGRLLANWESDDKLKVRPLGPKVAGGTAHAALALRVVDTEHMPDDLLFEHDIRQVVKRFKNIGIGFGGHIDDNQSGSNTGCGAVDNIASILNRLQRPEYQEQLRGLTQLVLGEAYEGRYIVNEVLGRMLYLDALKPTYLPRENNDPKGEFLYKKTIVKTIRDEANLSQESIPALSGPHNEVALLLNFDYGTTFDSDRFSSDNNNEIQVFGWDVWHMYEEARRLYTYNMYKNFDDQLEAITKRMKYVTTRTLLGIATLMVLTDGSLSLLTASASKSTK